MKNAFRRARRRACVLGIAAVAVAAFTASTVAPAAAAPSAAAAGVCEALVADGSQTSYAIAGSGSVAGRGGTAREPGLNQLHEDLPAAAKGRAGRDFRVTVPVYFHVITDGAIGRVTLQNIRDQIQVMNLAYAGFYGGVPTGFSFRLESVDYTDNAAWFYAIPSSGAEKEMKKTLRQGGANALNYYSTTAAGYLGWAYLPSTYDAQPYLDGIVVDWESMPGTSDTYAGEFDLGHTATHETGHWLDLEHTFYRGCSNYGDFVDDTPAEKVPSFGCPVGKDTCTAPGLDPIHNYMDYSDDPCYSEFTQGQAQRMRDAWLFYRAAG